MKKRPKLKQFSMKGRLPELAIFLFLGLMAIFAVFGNNKILELNGGCDQRSSPFMSEYYGDHRLITYCESGDAHLGEIASDYFSSLQYVHFNYAGYPLKEGVEIFFRNRAGKEIPIKLANAGESWRAAKILIPQEFQGKEIQLIVQDKSSNSFGWIGLGNVIIVKHFNISKFLEIIFVLIGLHICLVVWLSFFQRKIDSEISLLFLIVSLGLAGYASFWIYWINGTLGSVVSCLFLLGTLLFFISQIRQTGKTLLYAAHGVLLPISLYTFFILFVCFFPFNDVDTAGAASRWLNLPIDNVLPKIFADQIRAGQVSRPMVGDWLSSDRPPLQSGIYLLFMLRSDLLYQVSSSMLQTLVFLPFLVLLRRLGFSDLAPLALSAFALTSLMAVHTLFVWPKLLSTAYLLIFYLVTMTNLGRRLSHAMWLFMVGGSAALAMLSHGGAIFALLIIAICYLIRSPSHVLKFGIPAAGLSVLLYVPWFLYQRLFDPPGNRLVKWHIAGVIAPNGLSVTQAIKSSYSSLNFNAWLDGRIANLNMVFGGALKFFKELISLFSDPSISLQKWSSSLVGSSFFETFYSFWWFSPLLAFLVWTVLRGWRKSQLSSDFIWLGISSVLTLLAWCMLMYIPGSTTIHQGTFLPWVSLFIIATVLLWQASPVSFLVVATLNASVFISIYVLDIFFLETDYMYLTAVLLLLAAFIYTCKTSMRWFDIPVHLGSTFWHKVGHLRIPVNSFQSFRSEVSSHSGG